MDTQTSTAATAEEDVMIGLRQDLSVSGAILERAAIAISSLPETLLNDGSDRLLAIQRGLEDGLARADTIQSGLRLLDQLSTKADESGEAVTLSRHLRSTLHHHLGEARRIAALVDQLPTGGSLLLQ